MYVQPPVAVGLRIDRFMLARSRPPLARVRPVRRIQAKLQAVRVDLIRENVLFFNFKTFPYLCPEPVLTSVRGLVLKITWLTWSAIAFMP